MRGSPLLRAAIVLAGLLLLLIPLRALTRHSSPPPAQPASGPASAPAGLLVSIHSTRTPFAFRIEYLGKPVWEGESSSPEISKSLEIPFPAQGVDLAVSASWNEPGAAALRVELLPADDIPRTQFLWGDQNADEILTFR